MLISVFFRKVYLIICNDNQSITSYLLKIVKMPAIGFDSIKYQRIFFTLNNSSFLLTTHSYPMADIRLCYEKKPILADPTDVLLFLPSYQLLV
jgi:hypothetical protein